MSKLSVKELALLKKVAANPDLKVLFFRKVQGLKWFDALYDAGYFEAQNIPKPVPAKQEGYVNIPRWDIGDYLIKTASELTEDNSCEYVQRFLKIISDATAYAKEHDFGNYHTWRQFAEVISKIPSQFISKEIINVIDYWLEDKFERTLVADEVGMKWLVKLLKEDNENAHEIAVQLLEIMYKLHIIEQENGERTKRNIVFRLNHHHANKITKEVAYLAGCRLGRKAISVYHSKLEETLNALGNDTWSAIWQPAIDEHEQNKHKNKPANVLINGYRICLNGYLKHDYEEACNYVSEMMESPLQTVQRLAIHFITHRELLRLKYTERLIDHRFLRSNYRYEIWHFFNHNYAVFNQNHKNRIIEIISNVKRLDNNGALLEAATAYEQATWLAAIKDFGKREQNLYREAIAKAKAEPDHPDFSSYMSVRWGEQESSYSIDELSTLSIEELVHTLRTYKSEGGWRKPGIEGLVNVVKQLLKASPLRFYANLAKFADLDLAYVYVVIGAYSELWNEKASLPWDEIWRYLLEFCSTVVREERFWSEENARQRDIFVANRFWVVGAIGRLLEAGAKSDEHAFHEKYHCEVESLIAFLLQKEKGETFEEKSDAVLIAINSPRGHCIQALINLTLRLCRLSDRDNNRDHFEVWAHFQHYYDAELKHGENGEYEFSTLVTNYLPNFLYMSGDWVQANLGKIFDQTNYLKWLCAMQGYSYVGTVYQDIYLYLKKHGDLLKVLDDENIKERVEERAIQHIVIAYLNDFESLTDNNSLIRILINRKDHEELSQLIWFVWTLQKQENNRLRDKVYELWPLLMSAVDISTSNGRKLASCLCHWASFVDNLDEERKPLLLAIAPYAEELHNSYDLLNNLANLSNKHPLEANEIWLKVLEGSAPDYPEEAIRRLLSNLLTRGNEGKRLANETVSEYLKKGVQRPLALLQELANNS